MNTPLDAALRRALLDAVGRAWRAFNTDLFDGVMRPPVLRLDSTSHLLGRWVSSDRALALSESLVVSRPWPEVMEVLRHEMAHQYVDEVLKVRDEPPHGPRFRSVCALRGIDARAAGTLDVSSDAPDAPAADQARALRKIQRLLALAGSAEPHEAESAMAAAQRLLLKHNIDLAAQVAEGPAYVTRAVGTPALRLPAWERILSGILTGHFFVFGVYVPAYLPLRGETGTVLEITGTPENVEIAVWVHGFLVETAERGFQRARAGGLPGREHQRYLAGVMSGFARKLREQSAVAQEEGLVWLGDGRLDSWAGLRYPHLRRGRGVRVRMTEGWTEGVRAGGEIILHKPIVGDRGGRGGLLGG